jgi:hypothetical protein
MEPRLTFTHARNAAPAHHAVWRVLRRAVLVAALLASTSGAAVAQGMETVEVTVEWVNERCDFVLTRNDEGYGVVLKLTPVQVSAGDMLEGALARINYTGRVVNKSTGEAVMMRGLKYGVRRKEAVRSITGYSRNCKPPEE